MTRTAVNDNQGRPAPIEPPHTMDIGVRISGGVLKTFSAFSSQTGPEEQHAITLPGSFRAREVCTMGARGPVSSAALSVVPIANREAPGNVRVPKVPAPVHLSAASKKWWAEVNAEFALEPHHLRLLQAACESWERMQAARAAIAKHGLTFTDSQGNPKARPEVAIERDAKIGFARLIRELDLDGDPRT